MEESGEKVREVFGDVCIRKQRRKRQKILLIDLFFDFAKNTTLHGLRYIAERGLSVIEKLFWLFTFIASVALCFFLIKNVYMKWKTSPVIVSFSEQLVAVGDVPFPSVTICPQIKCKQTVYNYTEEYDRYFQEYLMKAPSNLSLEEMDSINKLTNIGLICDIDHITQQENYTAKSKIVEDILEVSPNISDIFYLCKWRGKVRVGQACEDFFKPVLTNEGICFNFNSLAANEIFWMRNIQKDYAYLDTMEPNRNWTIKKGYLNDDPDPYPRRGRENGANPDMEIVLKEKSDDRDKLCNAMNNGFKIYVQHPADMPQSALYYYAALPQQVSSIALKFSMLSTDKTLKTYYAEDRQCFFPKDRPLKYFHMYSASNCRIECLSIHTYRECNCVWMHLPHNDSREICGLEKKSCFQKVQEFLATNSKVCQCLPSCNSIQYDAEILKTQFDLGTYFKTMETVHKVNLSRLQSYEYSKVDLYFKEPRFISMRRSELFGLTDFLANIGGLLGLFLGFSFLSLVEIFYFLTLRTCCTLRRDLIEERHNSIKR